MKLAGVIGIILLCGIFGGFVNALLTDNGFALPKDDEWTGIWRPGSSATRSSVPLPRSSSGGRRRHWLSNMIWLFNRWRSPLWLVPVDLASSQLKLTSVF